MKFDHIKWLITLTGEYIKRLALYIHFHANSAFSHQSINHHFKFMVKELRTIKKISFQKGVSHEPLHFMILNKVKGLGCKKGLINCMT